TRFFAPGAPGDADDELDDAALVDPGDLESVLDDCVAARLPELRLAWHYRSRHEDLIAFANQRYYGDRLQVFPAASSAPDLGISWRRVDGVYDRAGTRQNRAEAAAVVSEVVARLRDPAHSARSIGVVTLSLAQRELIEDLLDDERAQRPELDRFFEPSAERPEPVIVKNLEAIQGDERDVVLVSIGYGPDASGALSLNLGPLSQRGGERRLNVAITRAREQLILISSVDPEDLSAANSQGVQDLAAVLAFARAGGGASRAQAAITAPAPRAATSLMAADDAATAPVATTDDATTRPVAVAVDWNASSPVAAALDGVSVEAVPGEAVPGEAPPASPITAAIARALAQRGWTLRHQVGCGAYKVDLAVVDPNAPERYVLAIETDGDAYASAATARDRDRLRAQVLG
ncbi:MAG: AAA domain-containing protein, partial [Solirubrobacteraceae bacterium]